MPFDHALEALPFGNSAGMNRIAFGKNLRQLYLVAKLFLQSTIPKLNRTSLGSGVGPGEMPGDGTICPGGFCFAVRKLQSGISIRLFRFDLRNYIGRHLYDGTGNELAVFVVDARHADFCSDQSVHNVRF